MALESYDYDLIVIGSGAGGGVAAHIAADAGKHVAIIEAEDVGGECPNWGCVPTKALLMSADVYETAKSAEQFGIKTGKVTADFKAIHKWRNQTVRNTGAEEGTQAFESQGITVIKGRAHFIDRHTISVGGRRHSARRFLIATGTKNVVPPVTGLAESKYLTYREAGLLTTMPKSLLIMGGGAIGCEFAEYFSSFGVKVTIVEMMDRLIGREDEEVGQLMTALFEQRGIRVLTSTKVIAIKMRNGKRVVQLDCGTEVKQLEFDQILVSAGKAPNTDLGLENAGVKYGPRGIEVNDMMQTSTKHIYAAGDVVGPYAFTHMASYQSRVAANNMLHRTKVRARYHAVPRCVFTNPEVACVGMTSFEAMQQKVKLRVGAVPISVIGRSNVTNQRAGFVKVLTTKSGVVVGASIVAPRAGEMIHELALAVNMGLKAQDLANTIHAFPTWSEAVRLACAKIK